MQRPTLSRPRPPRRSILIAGAAGALALVAIVVGALALNPAPPSEPAGSEAGFTMSAGWTLADLEHHLAQGDVVAVSASGTPGSADAGLLVRTSDGREIPVRLVVPATEAARALSALGYGSLLTDEALELARSGPLPAGGTASTGGPASLLPAALLGSVLLAAWFAMHRGRRPRRAAFAVVRPAARDRTASAGSGPPGPGRVSLDDVAGCDEAKAELTEVVDFLRAPERFARLGAVLPRGVLLYGPPGTGKTLLARAVAAEAGVAFVHASGSEFVEQFVGVGARRIRDLFAQARQLGRAVVFVDEFDALAKARGGPNGHEEREQTLNQLLVELDGFTPNANIVVIAATNRLDVLDRAVLRPGRFNRKVHVGLPDVRGRREILAVHARSKPLDPAIDLGDIARKTYGFSGAQLADLLNEAAILAARRAAEVIEPADVQSGWLKVAVGTGRRRSMDDRERAIIAAHEVGHAICGRVHGDGRRVEEISLFAHGDALGVTVSSQEDNDLPSESDLRARLVALMGGRAAEELLFHEVTGGASNDFEKATQIATTMVTRFAMGADPDAADAGPSGRGVLSLLVPRSGASLPSDVQGAATRAVRAILDQAYAQACETLTAHLGALRVIAARLVEEERIDGVTFDALFDAGTEPTRLDDWRPAAARPRAWDEVAAYRDSRFGRREGMGGRTGTPVPASSPGGAEAPPNGEPVPIPVAVTAPADPGPPDPAAAATPPADPGPPDPAAAARPEGTSPQAASPQAADEHPGDADDGAQRPA